MTRSINRSILLFGFTVSLFAPTASHAQDVFDRLSNLGLTLRERAEIDSNGKGAGPAKFAFADAAGKDAVFGFDGAVIWSPGWIGETDDESALEPIDFVASVDAHVSSADEEGERGLTTRAGVGLLWHLWDDPTAIYLEPGALYEADQSFDDQRVGAELKFTPQANIPGLGEAFLVCEKAFGRDWCDFEFRPWFGGTINVPIEQDQGADDAVMGRFFYTVRADFGLPGIARALAMVGVGAFVEWKQYVVLADEDPADGEHSFVQAGAAFALTKHIGVEAGYKHGELAPAFDTEVEQAYAGLTLKFGSL